MPDHKERVAELLQELLNAAPRRSDDPLFASLSDTVRKWAEQRQRVLDRLMTLVVKAQTEPAEPLAQEWKVEIERTRSLLKLIFRLDTGGIKLPMWAQNWMLATLIAEDDFFNELQMVQTIELIGKIRSEKMMLDVMQDHLLKKWTMLNDLTAPFRTQQMQAIDEIEKIANAFLAEFESGWRNLADKAGGAYKKVDENLEKFREKTKDWPIKEMVLAAIDAAASALNVNTEGMRDTINTSITQRTSETTEEALTSEAAFMQRVTNFAVLDIDDKIARINERTNRIFEDAVDAAFETVERSISDFPVEVSEVLLVESREMHAAVKAVLNEKLKEMIDASAVFGKMFDRSTLEEAFERRALVDAVDR